MKYANFVISDDRLAKAREAREKRRETYYNKAREVIGDEGVLALKEYMSLYDEKIYLWAASLWDTDRGGFYYSLSARNTEGFLPDIESTVQMMRFLSHSGIFEGRGEYYGDATPDFMKEKLVGFAQSLIDPEDGYAYHPQWGYNIIVSRRGRDLKWTVSMLRQFEVEPKYKTALDRLSEQGRCEEKNALLPEHLTSTEKFKEYLTQFEDPENKYCIYKWSYGLGNHLSSQTMQIKAAGEEYADILFEWIERFQRDDNGLFEEGICYKSINGLMKIILLYTSFERPFPNAIKALEGAIAVTAGNEVPGWVCCHYNPWITIHNLFINVSKFGDAKRADELKAQLQKNAASLIRNTYNKSKVFKKPDGGFSYYPETSSAGSQAAPVAPKRLPESDVNATAIASTGTLLNMCKALEIETVPIFCREDGEIFLDLIRNAEPIVKTEPIPENILNRSKERQY